MNKYICDKCNKEFNFEDNISICPYCGYKEIRNKKLPMKKLIRAKCSVTGIMDIIKHEDGYIELLSYHGEYETNIIGDIESEEYITNTKYDKLRK